MPYTVKDLPIDPPHSGCAEDDKFCIECGCDAVNCENPDEHEENWIDAEDYYSEMMYDCRD